MENPDFDNAQVVACDWEYRCPLHWHKLTPTDDPRVRSCGECKKDVTFCRDQGEVEALLQADPQACAAVVQPDPEEPRKMIRMTMGLPKRAFSKELRSLIDSL